MNGKSGVVAFNEQSAAGKLVCLGLDGDILRLPKSLLAVSDEDVPARHPLFLFGKRIVDAAHASLGSVKPNNAFFESAGWRGICALEYLVAYIRERYPTLLRIGDAKRMDIGKTNTQYGRGHFGHTGYNALTVNPYLGYGDALDYFVEDWPEVLFFVLARTSNKGAREIQDRVDRATGLPMWQYVIDQAMRRWNQMGNIGFVCGATYPDDLRWTREYGNMPILAPGIGVQGGNLELAVRMGGRRTTYNNSSAIIYASDGEDFAEAAAREAQRMHQQITKVLATREVP